MTAALLITFGVVVLILILIVSTGIGLYLTLKGSGPVDSVDRRLQTYTHVPDRVQSRRGGSMFRSPRLRQFRMRFNQALSIFISTQLHEQLVSANWPITTSEFALLRLLGSLLLALLAWLLSGSIFPGIGAFLIAYLIPGFALRRRILRRRERFERQLVDVLILMTGAVRAGYSLLQAMKVVEEEIGPPASEEIRRVIREVDLGRSVTDALNAMARRMENDDLELVVTSININQRVGGNMATMLEAVTGTIRERQRLFGEIRSQTSQQRFTGVFLTLMPVVVGAVLLVINPDYMVSLTEIACIPIGAVAGILLGNIIIRRMVNIKI